MKGVIFLLAIANLLSWAMRARAVLLLGQWVLLAENDTIRN